MTKPAPNPVEVQDFQFKLQCRFKIFANDSNAPFGNPCALVATASRFGLIFVGTATPSFQVIQINTIEGHSVKEGGVTDYNRRTIPVPSPPKHLAVNCDCSKLAVVVERNQCPIGLIYDIASMLQQEVAAPAEIRLSPTPGVNVLETSWNPTISNIFTACKSDGSLGLYELKETGIGINELPAEAQARCMCWSPKGKQIAVGSFDGKITQYKPDLKAMKVVNGPPLQGFPSVVALQWIANYQFIAVYKPPNPESTASLVVIDAPKTGDTVYTNYDDICYSNGNLRPTQFYMVFQSNWNILMVASSNSIEVGVLGSEADKWIQWTMADAARAELPLSASKQETMPIGLAIDTSSVEPFVWGETSLPPAPFLFVLSTDGVLCCFRIINVKPGATPICQAPACFADTSGLNQFTNPGPQSVPAKVSVAEPPKQPILPPPPQKLHEVSQQPAFSFAQSLPTSVPTLPQVPLFATPPTSQFENQFQPPATELTPPKSDTGSLFAPKPAAQNLFGLTVTQPVITVPAAPVKTAPAAPPVSFATTATSLVIPSVAAPVLTIGTSSPTSTPVASLTPITSPALPSQPTETNLGQEELDFLIGEVIREECDMLETELKAILHKGRLLKVDLGSDSEAVELVHGADTLEEFLKEVAETSSGQDAEVHHLKQGLIQTWAWYEDARSRFVQTQDTTLETLKRIQQLDPVSQRYQANIQHMVYYLESQLVQANRVLDEQWETFQDSCKKIVKLKIPTMEAVYQTMVRQCATHQKQVYILKDISRQIRAQRNRISQPSVLVSLNSADQLERELRRLQLEPQHFLQAQYERVVQNQQRFTASKMQKLSKLLMEKDNINVTPSRPKLSNTKLHTTLQTSLALRKAVEPSLLGAGLSPIATRKQLEPRVVDFIQSTPKHGTITLDPKQVSVSLVTPVSVPAKPMMAPTSLPTNSAIKLLLNTTNSAPSVFSQLPVTTTTTAAPKPETNAIATSTTPFKFAAIPSTSMFSLGTTTLVTSASNVTQPSFSVSITKITSTPTPFTMVPISQAKSSGETITTKPSASFGSLFGSTKPAASTFSFSLTTTTAASSTVSQPANTKLLTSTANSAFVPTTQLAFNFSAKSSTGTSVANSAVSTSTAAKLPTFIFGTGTAVTPSGTTTISASSIVSTTSATVPSSTSIAVTATAAASVITVPIFSTVKTSSFDSVSVTTGVTSPTPALSKPNTETTSIVQGIVAPKPVSTAAQESAAVVEQPTIGDVSSTSDKKEATSTTAVPNQGLLFGIGSTATQQSSLLNLVKSSSASQLQPATVQSPVTTPQSEKVTESQSIFTQVPLPTNSAFGAATPTTTTALIFGTTTGSIFGSGVTTTGPLFGTTAPTVATTTSLVFGVSTSSVGSIFASSTTALAGSLFSSTTTTSSGSTFGATPAASPSVFGAVGTQPGAVLGTTQVASTVAAALPTTSFAATTTTITTTTVLGTAVATPTSPTFITPTTTSSSIFGSIAATSSSSIFGSRPATDSTFGGAPSTTSSSIFGSAATTPSGSIFGATTTGSLFGAVPVTSSSIFGSPTFAPAATSAASIFAQTPSTAPSVFGGAAATSTVFGGPPKSTTTSIFGSAPFATASVSPFGGTTTTPGTAFGQPATVGGGSIFGAPVSSSTNTFGSTSPVTGGFGSGGSVFGGSNTASNNFNQAPTSPFSFAAAAANVPSTNSAFGFPEQSAFGFTGATPLSSNPSSFSFGNLNVGSPTATAGSSFSSSFGQPSNSNPFAKIGAQQQKPDFGSTSLLGTPATTASSSSSIFGGGSSSGFGSSFGAPAFGSPSFGQQPAFGQGSFGSSFGNSGQPGPFSGGNQSVAQTGFGGFGQPQKPTGFGAAPVFGGSPTAFGTAPAFGGGSSAFGASPGFGEASKVFGGPAPATGGTFGAPPQQENSTFANLATQNTLGFGSLAQQTPSNSPMSSFSGGGSFSTWR